MTLTLKHGRRDRLATTLRACLKAWSAVLVGKGWMECKSTFGIAGWIRCYEITLNDEPGGSGKRPGGGWHPHIHALLLLDNPEKLDDEQLEGLRADIFKRWSGSLAKSGLEKPSFQRGIRIDRTVKGDSGVGAYLAKDTSMDGAISRSAERVSTEMLRGDIKKSWSGLTPFELLDEDGGDRHAYAMARFLEFEDAVWGKRTLTYSNSARELLGLAVKTERTDQEIVEEPDPAPVVCGLLDFSQWRELRARPDALVRVLGMMEQGAHAQACWWLESLVGDVERGPGWAAVPGPPGTGPPGVTASGGVA